jgi:putative ABC transport system permease protein
MRMATPPRLATVFLRRLLPDDGTGRSVAGDLFEEFQSRGGGVRATSWYWREVLRIGLRSAGFRASRAFRGKPMIDLTGDLQTAIRTIARTPGTSSLIVATLAVSIGAATLAFAFADLALFRGLPVDDPSRVVSAFMTDTRGLNPRGLLSAPDYLDVRARSRTLVALSAYRTARVPLIDEGESRTLDAGLVTADFFTSMARPIALGRGFLPGDDDPAGPRVLLLSHRAWQETWSGRTDVLGRALRIGREIYTVVGVVAPEMEFGSLAEYDVWLPLVLSRDEPRDVRHLRVIGRLADGVTFDTAAAELASIGDVLAAEHPVTNTGQRVRLVRIRDVVGGNGFWVVVALFLLSIGLLMTVATANVAGLVLVRAIGRQQELAVRAALGAGHLRLVRQFVIEGLVLSGAGAMLAVPVAALTLTSIGAWSSDPVFRQIRIDAHEIGFVAALAVVCPLVFSLAPVGNVLGHDVRHLLVAGGTRGTTARSRGRSVLVVSQIALAVVLLSASSLALRSIRQFWNEPLGIEIHRLLILTLEFNDAIYPDAGAARAAARSTLAALAALPGVEASAAISPLPAFGGDMQTTFVVDGAPTAPGEGRPAAALSETTAGGGAALGLSLLGGEWWRPDADAREPDVAVVSRATAERYLGGAERALGRRLTLTRGTTTRTLRVVGVSSDVRGGQLAVDAPARIWMPLEPGTRRMTFLVRTGGAPDTLAPAVRTTVPAVAPAIPIEDLRTMSEAIRRARSSDFTVVSMLAGFALLALGLAATGLFGLVSYSVSQRTAEFGTRLALGARGWTLVGLVAGDVARLIAWGLAIGLAGGVAVGYGIRGVLYRTAPADPLTIGGVAGLLAFIAVLATVWPAVRAARLDPVQALRGEGRQPNP